MIEVYYAEDDETIGKSVKEYLEQQNCKVAVFDRIADVKKALIGHLPTIVLDRKSTRLNSSHPLSSRMPSSA